MVDKFLTTGEGARLINEKYGAALSPPAIRQWCAEGKLEHTMAGGRYLVTAKDLLSFWREHITGIYEKVQQEGTDRLT